MYIGHARLCVCVSVCPRPHNHTSALEALAMMRYINLRFTLHYTDPDVTCGNARGAPSCALLDGFAIGAFRCYDNIARTRNVSECLYAVYLVIIIGPHRSATYYTALPICAYCYRPRLALSVGPSQS